MKTHYKIKDRLVSQAIAERDFAISYRRQKRHAEWKKNEQLLKSYELADEETRSRTPLFQAISLEETLLSKIDNSVSFKMTPGEVGDTLKATRLNALRERDAKIDRWDKKDRSSKRDMIRYGRAIYSYTAVGTDGEYAPNLRKIRPRNFYIDPDIGDNEIEEAKYLGWDGVKKTKKQLLDGIKAGIYDKKVTEELINNGSNYYDTGTDDIEERNADNTPSPTGNEKKTPNQSIWVFSQHFTYDYETDERYIILMTPNGTCIRCQKWTEVEPEGLYPIITYASSPDSAEFWSISILERVRAIFKKMEKSINQMIDNADRVNKPKLAVNVDFIRNLAQVKYGSGGFVEVNGKIDANRAVSAILTPSIDTPLRVFDKLQGILDREVGVTAQAAGVADTDGVLGIYEGNQQNLGDRIGLLNKEYSEAYYQLGVLWLAGVKAHLTKKVAVKMLGIHGVSMEEVSWTDLKPGKHDYDIVIQSNNAEAQASQADMKNKLEVLTGFKGDELINQRIVREKTLDLTGFTEDDKRMLLDIKNGSEAMITRAYEDMEKLIMLKEVKVPTNANLEYVETLTQLWEDKDQDIEKMYKGGRKAKMVQDNIQNYIQEATIIVERNMAKQMLEEQMTQGMIPADAGQGKGGAIDPAKINDPQAGGVPKDMGLQEPMQ